jgi:hypothetical protein
MIGGVFEIEHERVLQPVLVECSWEGGCFEERRR